jgi:hypothetical protein
LPVVHIQNIAQPFYYEGMSDVETLIPLQDELNTRLSDRANRITFQTFKMYLGKGIEGFEDKPVAPGRMWYTDNPEASIEEFGGDAATPSEALHIAEIREAMDKVSAVTPIVAAGKISARPTINRRIQFLEERGLTRLAGAGQHHGRELGGRPGENGRQARGM